MATGPVSPAGMFADRLASAVSASAPCCVGLDPHRGRFARHRQEKMTSPSNTAQQVLEWGMEVLDAVDGLVPVVKPQVGFFEPLGYRGWAVLEQLCAEARRRGLIVLLDAKRGDIGSTAEGYAQALLDNDGPIAADAVTLSPYMGRDSIEPFLARCDEQAKGLFVLVRTSNRGGADLQPGKAAPEVASWLRAWNADRRGDCGLGPVGAVVGATVPEEAAALRDQLATSWILVPGYGAQGGTAGDTHPNFLPNGHGALVNSSRGVLFPSPDLADAYEDDAVAVVRANARRFTEDIRGSFRANPPL